MKKLIITAAILVAMSIGSTQLFAQPPAPGGIVHGETGNQAAAPVGGGLALLIGMGAAYAGIRFRNNRKEEE